MISYCKKNALSLFTDITFACFVFLFGQLENSYVFFSLA